MALWGISTLNLNVELELELEYLILKNMPTTNFKIDSAIICDDIRIENNNKRMFIGVYDKLIDLPHIPAILPFWICLIGKIKGEGFSIDIMFEFRAEDKEKSRSFKSGVSLKPGTPTIDDWADVLIPLMAPPLEIECAGELLIKIKARTAKRWKTISQKPIHVADLSAIEQQQPS